MHRPDHLYTGWALSETNEHRFRLAMFGWHSSLHKIEREQRKEQDAQIRLALRLRSATEFIQETQND